MRCRYCYSEASVENRQENTQKQRNTKGIKKENIEIANLNESTLYPATQ